MNIFQAKISIETAKRGIFEISAKIKSLVDEANVKTGVCSLFIKHTSASLIISENADPAVRCDLEAFMAKLIPEDLSLYSHTEEGPDDMPAHNRAVLTQSAITIPICAEQLALGRWQGIYLWEHRAAPHKRVILVTIMGI